ncbi:MAG: hypothetical protein ACRD28_00790 [Acidobacteriaceae bacterium]
MKQIAATLIVAATFGAGAYLAMGKLIELPSEPAFCSIPLKLAVYCENCETISNSRPYRCGVCDSEAVVRVEPVFNRNPEPPATAAVPLKLSVLRAVGA